MKRKVFNITVNGEPLQNRSTFNVCWRAIEADVKTKAVIDNCVYRLKEKEAKDNFTKGHCLWVGDNGKSYRYEIITM